MGGAARAVSGAIGPTPPIPLPTFPYLGWRPRTAEAILLLVTPLNTPPLLSSHRARASHHSIEPRVASPDSTTYYYDYYRYYHYDYYRYYHYDYCRYYYDYFHYHHHHHHHHHHQ